MAMKKNISKALALAVMMSVLAGGQAYAVNPSKVILAGTVDKWEDAALSGIHVNNYTSELVLDSHSSLYGDDLYFFDKDSNKLARYGSDSMMLGSIKLDTTNGLDMGGLDITNVNDLTVNGAIHASASGAIASGDTGLVTGGAVYTALQGKQDKLTETQLANLNADHSKYLTEHQDISGKADKATTLAGYGITDGATKTELADEAKAREQGDADTLKKANEYTDQEIAKISGGASSEALEKLDSKINQTNDRVDRVGATAAALAGIHYQPMAKGQSQVAVGMGGYKGKKATALGLAYQISDRVSGSVAGAANGSERMFNVGFNYLFGQHSDKDIAQCAAVPGSVSLKEAELQAQVDSLNNKVAQLEAMVKALAAK